MRHLTAALAAVLITILVSGAALALSARTALERTRVTAVFAPGTAMEEIFLRVAMTEGRIIQGTLLPFAVEVAGETPGIAARLDAAGAWLVLSELPASALAVGGCTNLSIRTPDGRSPGF